MQPVPARYKNFIIYALPFSLQVAAFCNIILNNIRNGGPRKSPRQTAGTGRSRVLEMDTYVECMVKKKANGAMNALKILLWVIAGFTFVLGMASFIFLIVAIGVGVGAYFLGLNANLEYEYLYVDRQLTVDKIMAKTRRKRVETFDLDRMEMLAPIKSWHLEDYKNRQFKTVDYSAGVEEKPDRRYCMIYNGEKKVIFQPNEEMVTAIKSVAPRKVFTD